MPTIRFEGEEIECSQGDVLRDAMLDAGLSPHNGTSKRLNCRGHATCGTCAVEVSGDVSEMRDDERRRLSLPPHDEDSGLRLACQARVQGDVEVIKHPGFWGQKVRRDETMDAAEERRSESVEPGADE
jgi:ferredoxin